MAIKRKVNFNVDKLKLCYKFNEQLFNILQTISVGDKFQLDCFYLLILDNDRNEETNTPCTTIVAKVVLDEDFKAFGTFTFHRGNKYSNLCFFEFENETLYTQSTIINGQKHNTTIYLEYIADSLNLELNNVTQIDIAADVNFNVITKLRSLIKNYQNYDFIYNGKRLKDEKRKIQNYSEHFSRSRIKLLGTPTLYLSQAKDEGLKIKIYNKTEEIKEASSYKTYINKWNNFGKQQTYRIEISIRNNDFKKFCTYCLSEEVDKPNWGQKECILTFLGDEEYKSLLWHFGTLRIAYFRPKTRNAEAITLYDLITNENAMHSPRL